MHRVLLISLLIALVVACAATPTAAISESGAPVANRKLLLKIAGESSFWFGTDKASIKRRLHYAILMFDSPQSLPNCYVDAHFPYASAGYY